MMVLMMMTMMKRMKRTKMTPSLPLPLPPHWLTHCLSTTLSGYRPIAVCTFYYCPNSIVLIVTFISF